MLFRDGFDFDNTDLLNVMTDIHVHTNYVTINDIHYDFNTPREKMMEWDDAYERIKLIETRTVDTSCVHYVDLDELTPEAQTAVLNTWGLATEKDVIS